MKLHRNDSWNDFLGRLYLSYDMPHDEIVRKRARVITFQVTEDCNLRCTYCYQGAKTKRKMTLETGKRIVDLILENNDKLDAYIASRDIAGVTLDFIGGEPFLEVELIDSIMDYFVERAFELQHPLATRFKISISTNGTLYFSEPVQRFIQKWHRHLSLSVSVDGNKALHDACRVFPDGSGSYDLALAAALDYRAKYGYIGSKMTIAPGNVAYIADAVGEMLDNGYSEIFLNCIFEEGWTIDHARTLYKQLKALADRLLATDDPAYLSIFDDWIGHPMSEDDNQNWCGGTGSMLAFDPDGKAYPCIRYMPSSLNGQQPPLTIGNLEDGVCVCERDCQTACMLNSITRRSQSTDACWNCPIASGCAWCSGYNYQVFGTPNKRATFICVMHRARVLANCYYWNSLYRQQNLPTRYALDIPELWGREIVGDEYDALCALAEVN